METQASAQHRRGVKQNTGDHSSETLSLRDLRARSLSS
jgi:hypothetical protein